MNIFESLILGLVQGLGEFLPISSSAHLVLVPWLLKFPDPGLAFDVALHIGTALALVVYFRKELYELLIAFFQSITKPDFKNNFQQRLAWMIIAASVPGAVLGLLFEDVIETSLRNPLIIGILLIVMAGVLVLAEVLGRKTNEFEKLTFIQALLIGLAQSLALIPGVSRSGITIATGLFCGLQRDSSAKFSFLLATPIVLGAGLLKIKYIIGQGFGSDPLIFWVGFLTSAISGFLAIKFLLSFLKKYSLYFFVWYRVILGIIVVLVYFVRK